MRLSQGCDAANMAEEFAKSLERYDVVDRIAVGGMAEVFLAKAYGAHGFEKTLAIKRILPDLARDPEFEARFIAEAKVAVKLSHTNIVQVMDFGRFAESLFIAMEYVDGLDLAAFLRRYKDQGRRVPITAAFQIAIEIARGLDYAHQHNVVHRDVSPSNILISRAGEVKIADFGIAVAANRALAAHGPRKVMGKWRYMSPEQARGENLDTRSDLFSAATVMYELFTGEKLFPGDEPEDIIRNIYEMPLPRPSKVRDGLPARLDEILHTALARRPLDRPARAAVMLRALTELSYESSIVCTTLDVSDAVAAVLPRDQTGASVVDEMIRRQLAGETGVARETAVTDGKKRETAVESAKVAGIDTTGVFRHKIDLDGVSRLESEEIGHSTTLAAHPRSRRQTGQPEAADDVARGPTLTGLAAAVAELGVTVPIDPDRRTEVGPPLAESRPFFKQEPEDQTSARPKVEARAEWSKSPPKGAPAPEVTPTGTGPTPPASRRAWVVLALLAVGGAAAGVYALTRGPETQIPVIVTAADAAPAPRAMGAGDFASEPSGANLFVDGELVGTTPRTVTLAAGDHRVAMDLTGRRRQEQKVTIVAGETAKVTWELAVLPARLYVRSTPDGATVRLGGVDLGRTPLDRDGLTPGTGVMLEVTRLGFLPHREKIDLVAGEKLEKDYALVEAQRFGKLQLSIKDGVADILDDKGKKLGVAALGGGTVITLPVGTHRLRLVSKTKGKGEITVEVVEGKTIQKLVPLHD
jgi:tRNA A-37 threonylcarbamoyl transferase component Bud32